MSTKKFNLGGNDYDIDEATQTVRIPIHKAEQLNDILKKVNNLIAINNPPPIVLTPSAAINLVNSNIGDLNAAVARGAFSSGSSKQKSREWYLDLLKLPTKPYLHEVPQKMRDPALVAAYQAAGAHVNIKDIPVEQLDEAKVLNWIAHNKVSIYDIPKNFHTYAVIDALIDKKVIVDTRDIPKDLITRGRVIKLIDNASLNSWRSIGVPPSMMDQEIVDKLKAKNLLFMCQVPKQLMTEELCTELFKKGRGSLTDIPKSKMSKEVVLLASQNGFIDLESIPVKLRDVEVCTAYVRKTPSNILHVPAKILNQVKQNCGL